MMKKMRKITYKAPIRVMLPDDNIVELVYANDKLRRKDYLLITNVTSKGKVKVTNAVELGEPYLLTPQKRTIWERIMRKPVVMKEERLGDE